MSHSKEKKVLEVKCIGKKIIVCSTTSTYIIYSYNNVSKTTPQNRKFWKMHQAVIRALISFGEHQASILSSFDQRLRPHEFPTGYIYILLHTLNCKMQNFQDLLSK